jgi:hypothetical protein
MMERKVERGPAAHQASEAILSITVHLSSAVAVASEVAANIPSVGNRPVPFGIGPGGRNFPSFVFGPQRSRATK